MKVKVAPWSKQVKTSLTLAELKEEKGVKKNLKKCLHRALWTLRFVSVPPR